MNLSTKLKSDILLTLKEVLADEQEAGAKENEVTVIHQAISSVEAGEITPQVVKLLEQIAESYDICAASSGDANPDDNFDFEMRSANIDYLLDELGMSRHP